MSFQVKKYTGAAGIKILIVFILHSCLLVIKYTIAPRLWGGQLRGTPKPGGGT